jgi:hypothetical protein
MGPGNFFRLIDADQTMKLKDFLRYIRDNASPGVKVDFISASRYLRTTNTGVSTAPSVEANETMNYFDDLQALYPTVLANADWKIDEFGFVGGGLPGTQPGAYGGAVIFNLICHLLDRGIDEMQHWLSPMVYDGGGSNGLWTSLASIFTIFDHLKGGDAYVRSITPLLTSAEGMSMVVKKDQYTYVIMAAANVSRSTQPTQNFTYSFPVSEATFTDPAGVQIEYLSLDRTTVPHDILRNDLATAGLLVSPFSGNANWVADVNSMAGTAGRTYLNQNFSKYSQAYVSAMTLRNYTGSLTRSGSPFRLAVQNMRTPSIIVFRMSSGTTTPNAPSNLRASAANSTRINLTWTDNSNNETGFLIQRRIGNGSWSNLATVGANVTSFANTGLVAGTTYGYRVRANGSSGNSVFTAEATATTPAATGGSGSILREVWTGISGTTIGALTNDGRFPASPTSSNQITSFEAPTNWADNYGTRVRGFIHPSTSGSYTFWIAADDNAELWLSTNDSVGNARRIAHVPGWSSSRQWTKYPEQRSVSINLTGGQRYYIEAVQKEGGGGDNLAVAWSGPGISGPVVIAGPYLSPWTGGSVGAVVSTASIPNAPSNLRASAVSATQVNLIWTDNSNNETGFLIQRRIGTGTWGNNVIVPANTTSYAVTGLTADTSYGFRVRANGTAGNSAFTTATATTPATASNLILNPGFENNLTAWNNWQYGPLSITSDARSGTRALRCDSGTYGSGLGQNVTSSLQPNTTYTLSVWGKRVNGNQWAGAGLKLYNGDTVVMDAFVDFTSTNWEQKTITITTPAQFNHADVWVWNNPGGSLIVDDFNLRTGN